LENVTVKIMLALLLDHIQSKCGKVIVTIIFLKVTAIFFYLFGVLVGG
jgi:hypothetical protein